MDTVVFVPNATTAINTILRNLTWNDDSKDEILYFPTIYGSCKNTVLNIQEYFGGKATGRPLPITLPIEDDDYVQALRDGISKSREEGKRPRLVIFDTVTSGPGVRVPFEALTAVCHQESVLSVIDGAHGVGNVPLNLSTLDPDFFFSNCHKWLYTPRTCCVLYIPIRNQALIRTTIPSSNVLAKHSAAPKLSEFVELFQYLGTANDSAFLCVTEALLFRKEACGGEDAIMAYKMNLAKSGGAKVAEILGTYVLDNSTNTMTNCSMVNVRMPLTSVKSEAEEHPEWGFVEEKDQENVSILFTQATIEEFGTCLPTLPLGGRWWTRMSAEVYLDEEDFEWAARVLKGLCERVGQGEFRS